MMVNMSMSPEVKNDGENVDVTVMSKMRMKCENVSLMSRMMEKFE